MPGLALKHMVMRTIRWESAQDSLNWNSISLNWNSISLNWNSDSLNWNSDLLNQNGVLLNQNGVLLNQNSVLLNQNSDSLNWNGDPKWRLATTEFGLSQPASTALRRVTRSSTG